MDTAVPVLYVAAYAAALWIDLRTGRIPNRITYPLLLIGLVARPREIGVVSLANVIAAVIAFALFAAFAFRGWMGMGDAKLAAVIALASGPALATIALWLAFAVGAVVGLVLLATRRIDRRQPIPFGPFLALAGAAAILIPDVLVERSPFGPLFG
ncbi:MAG TPA: A24 family peptidase [Candidatus Limnocylindria bacterium]|nr:A24 family peptidase [Candidatus Limnocylindria bacterium]